MDLPQFQKNDPNITKYVIYEVCKKKSYFSK